MTSTLHTLKNEVQEVLTNNILPYWINRMIDNRGGFYGRINGHDEIIPESDKGAILNARILWTFSAAYRLFRRKDYLQVATRAKRVIVNDFFDKEYGGIYWKLNCNATPIDTKKQFYALGFAIYGLSEYHRATGDEEALEYAIRLFNDIEAHSFDDKKNGYCEASTRNWQELADMRLSEKDDNERKTMNTHLHILEPYTNLYRVWKDDRLKEQIYNLIQLFIQKIKHPSTHHLQLFFDDDWNSKHNIISYGHDIEASWLIHEAALELNDAQLLVKVEKVIKDIAQAAAEGLTENGGMIYEKDMDRTHTDTDYHWWVQAETVVGYINLYQHFGDKENLHRAIRCWDCIKKHLIDHTNGEWLWSVHADGTPNHEDDKAGFWKCPYHNGRMCMEIIERYNLTFKAEEV